MLQSQLEICNLRVEAALGLKKGGQINNSITLQEGHYLGSQCPRELTRIFSKQFENYLPGAVLLDNKHT